MRKKNKLIIFDMDNTLIHSHINFTLMKSETCRLLREAGLCPDESLPVSQMLNGFKEAGELTHEVEERIWRAINEIEASGLTGATAEPHIEQVLEYLTPYAHLAALTNTNEQAARYALEQLGLSRWLNYIMGRGGAPELKPAPGGMLALAARFPWLSPAGILVVGDALIDIRAARTAGLAFCAYNRSRLENWREAGYQPDLQFNAWDEKAAQAMLAFLQ
ncbi:MAG: HAD hydrolase-like protein [Clostridiales bacterium]|nr:HAD hydrolase-like protein [Clostridiales bacterium]